LLEKPGEVVTREALREKLWPEGTFVNYDANVNTTVNKLRLVLGDSSDQPAYIETIPRLGYCFVGSVERTSELAKAIVPAAAVEKSQGAILPFDVEPAIGGQAVPAKAAPSVNFWSSARNKVWAGVVLLCGVLIGMGIVLLAHRVFAGS
jgi:DNA-binding winged helix-turn-helix (wHTH) protein